MIKITSSAERKKQKKIVTILITIGSILGVTLMILPFVPITSNDFLHLEMSREESIVANVISHEAATISTGFRSTMAIKSDGTVIVATGSTDFDYSEILDWHNIVAVSVGGSLMGEHLAIGLKSDGTVVAVGSNEHGQLDVDDWYDIVQVSAGGIHTVGLRADGTVMAVGDNSAGQLDVDSWHDIVAISAGRGYTVGLRSDGTVVGVGWDGSGQVRRTRDWSDIIAISADWHNTVGLRSDGTVVFTREGSRFSNVSNWRNIIAITNGSLGDTFGLRYNGTVVTTSSRVDLSDWSDIVAISAAEDHVVGLKSDGTMIAAALGHRGPLPPELQISDWYEIKLP